ncbi:hypothetical protein EJ04DRAFT_298300 [Polyplosphaeria fusca]|uniref:DUF1772-domain-containing protein n=1 Tax=Polyplosphaeria fusca TaxID=682080 RepID=A0A9P4QSH9_9PLEO|nr:hypothetical protein EJ04DRAFT_298300 [Polyplosphaeria fusca]
MSDNIIVKSVVGTCISFSFILAGNVITQCFTTIPALLIDFPSPGTKDHTSRARLLGRQWPLCWSVGNQFFRPISAFGIFGYAYTAYQTYRANDRIGGDWKLLAVAAGMHVATLVHSVVNMQPLNDRLEGLAKASEKELGEAEGIARKWARWNLVRLVNPAVAGVCAIVFLVA